MSKILSKITGKVKVEFNSISNGVLTLDGITYNFSEKKQYPWFDAFANDHISAFTPEGIKYILEESDLHIVDIIQSTKTHFYKKNE